MDTMLIADVQSVQSRCAARDGGRRIEDSGVHEFSLCQALLQQVGQLAREHRAVAVRHITLQIGPLSGVEPALLAEAFAVARLAESHGVRLREAELALEPLPLRVRCSQCGSETLASPQRLVCAQCGDWRTGLVSGDELMLRRVEFVLDPDASGHAAEDRPCATRAAAV